MAGPWERYQRVDGPWMRYAKPTAPAQAAAPQAPVDLGPVQTTKKARSINFPGLPEPITDRDVRNLRVGVQSVGRGLADLVGGPADLSAALANIGISGINLFRDDPIPPTGPPVFGSESISDAVGAAARKVGIPIIPEDELSGLENLSYNINRFGTAATTGAHAAALASATAPAASTLGQMFQRITEPYRAGTAAIIGDTGAGVGAGVANTAIDEGYLGEWGDSPLGRMLATIIGGLGGQMATDVATGAITGATRAARNAWDGPDPDAPVNPATRRSMKRSEMDAAAEVVQQMPSDRTRTIENVRREANNYRGFDESTPFSEGPPVPKNAMPTTGMMADDVGMAMEENTARVRNARPFAERDAARHAYIAGEADKTAPASANPRALTEYGNVTVDDMRRVSEAAVDSAADAQDEITRRSAAEATNLSAAARTQDEISGRIAEAWNTVLDNLRGRKNALYDSADPATEVAGTPLFNQLRNIRNSVPEAGRTGPFQSLYDDIARQLQGVDPETGAPTIRDTTYGDIAEWLAQSRQTRQEIVAAGGSPRNLDRIRSALSRIADEMNPDAAAFYRDEYVPRAKTGVAGQYENLRKRAARTGEASTATRPEDFANRFFRKPSDVRQFLTSMGDDLDDETRRAVSEWMAGDLAKAAGTPSNPGARVQAMRRWRDRNSAVLDMLPEARSRVDAEINRAVRLAEEAVGAREGTAAAKVLRTDTENTINRSSLGSIYNKSPVKAVETIFNGGDPERQMADLINRVGQNPEARDGLKAAVRDFILQRTRTTSHAIGTEGGRKTSRAALVKLFDQHENVLRQVYTPKEMNALRRMHKMLDVEGLLDARATAGSNTADKLNAQAQSAARQRMRVLEGALKARYGVLKGGGLLRTLRVFMETLPNDNTAMDHLLTQMWFDPDLALHLLERPVRDINTARWNWQLQKILAAGAGAREMNEEQPSP